LSTTSVARARYIMLGGFLGAGKTTAVAALARYLGERGLRVGLITNDQSSGLVDSAILRSRGFDVAEIAGGCFCCRFHSLEEAVEELSADTRPDVFLAEPVGSCTDLVATVSYPLRRIYGERFSIAPLSVLVDPQRAARILGLAEGRSFSPKVVYVYEKQLEEADLIVINKCDSIDESLRARLETELRERYPRAEVLSCSARDGHGLDSWFERVLTDECVERETMQLDYEEYAAGEALLGWLNCTVAIDAREAFDANAVLLELVTRLRDDLYASEREVAHLKVTLDAESEAGQLAVVSLVTGDGEPDVRESLLDRVDAGSLILNLRAEGDPEELARATDRALRAVFGAHPAIAWSVEHEEHFRPGRPVPVHRLSVPPSTAASS